MKIAAIRLVGLWGCTLAALGAPLCTGAQLLENSGFEQGVTGWRASFGSDLAARHVTGDDAANGRGCLRLHAEGRAIGVDSRRLRIGRDLNRRASYRVSAMIRNRGVRTGDFGLRLYFYDAGGDFVAMKGGIRVGPSTPEHDWRRYTAEFGRGTSQPFPAGAATVLVRFSLWGEGNTAVGDVWLDDVEVTALDGGEAPPARTERVALLWEESGVGNEALRGLLADAGFVVRSVDTDQLVGADALTTETSDLLVLPTGPRYPGPLSQRLDTYLQEGGGLMTFGINPLSEPLWHTDKGWMPAGATDPEFAGISISVKLGWLTKNLGKGEAFHMAPDPGCGYARFTTPDLQNYAYIGTRLVVPPPDPAVLCFEARGDGATDRLCVEIQARDGSRWKALVPLDETWRSHRIHLSEFVSYASEGRGGTGDACAAKEAETLLFGYTAPMVGKGRHQFDLRGVSFRRGVIPAADLATRSWYARPGLEPQRWFGDLASCPRRLPSPLGLAYSLPRGAERLMGHATETASGVSATGHWRVMPRQLLDPVRPSGGEGRRSLRTKLREDARRDATLPLLWARGSDIGTGSVEIASTLLNRSGRFAGSWIAVLGIDARHIVDEPLVRDAARAAAQLIYRGLWIGAPRCVFRAQDNGVNMNVVVPVQNTSSAERRIPLDTVVRFGDEPASGATTALLDIPPWQTVPAEMTVCRALPVPDAAHLGLSVSVMPSSGGTQSPFMPVGTLTVDARKALRTLCDFMVSEADDDGKLHGYSFIDNRGMRTLLAGFELFGDRRYRETALRWGRLMIELQRNDGGYRMGYGITSRGEECYVADGGEIAVGMARLVSYTEGEERNRFLASLDAYMRYRESFRVDSGGIGVGWCLSDYGQRPIVRLDKPTRILAPERNTYTIGCSLAAAYAHARLRHSAELEAQAGADADWLIERASSLNGAFIESYIYAHYFTTNPQRRKLYEAFIHRAFTERMVAPDAGSWWLGGDGRSALNLDGLVYVYNVLDTTPVVRAEILEAMCAMFAEESPESMLPLTDGRPLGHGEWIYICFGGLGLADAIRPMVTMENFLPDEQTAR